MARYYLISDDLLQRIEHVLELLEPLSEQVRGLRDTLRHSGTITLPTGGQERRPAEYGVSPAAAQAVPTKTYPIGVGEDEFSYVQVVDDLVADEVLDDEFALNAAWKVVKGVIRTSAKRPRDAFRQALDKEGSGYRRIRRPEGKDDPGIWYRRVDPGQPSLLADDDERRERFRIVAGRR